ncbi:MAG TPA: ABC transporter substrate-binding protein [Verrucomicrobiae bacterium]|nr:ABC transporter substrate-binding protein [Verrucomicrobiae bacterium]
MKISFASAATVLAALILVAGCGKQSENSAPNATAANYPLPDPPLVVDCQAGIPGGRFVVSAIGDPKTFNFIMANESSSIDIDRLLFWGLLNFDEPTQTVKPGLAYWWTNSPDGKTWTFKLRKNLRWSDGAPLTADDVIFTWNDVIYNTNINTVTRDPFILDGKEFKVTKLDDWTIQVVTPKVYAPFLEAFGAGVPIMPKHVLEKFVTNGTFASAYGVNARPEDVVGDGPFRLKEYKAAQYTLLERNPYFLETDTNGQRLPYFNDIIFQVVPDVNAAFLRFLSGESDEVGVPPYEYDHFKAESADGKFDLLDPGIGLEMNFLWFNENTNVDPTTGKPYVDPVKLSWFRNVKFRQAVSYAIDREAIIKSIYSDRGIPSYGYDTPGNKKWFDPNTPQYPFDPAKALAFLKEIGIEKRNGDDFLTDSNGNRIEFVFNIPTGSDAVEKTAVLIESDLQNLGMKVILQPIEFNTLVNKIDDTYNYDCVLLGLQPGTSADPSDSMNVLESSGFTHEWFPRETTPSTPWEARIDTLMDDQIQTLDLARRQKDYDEIQEILGEEQPMIFTATPMEYVAIRKGIGNLRPTALTSYRVSWNAEELYFETNR